MFEFLMVHRGQILPVGYAQDPAGGETQAVPATIAPSIPCLLQQDRGPSPEPGGQGRRKSTAAVTVYFSADPGVKVNDRIWVTLRPGAIVQVVAEGPAYDMSGQSDGPFGFAIVWQVDAKVTT